MRNLYILIFLCCPMATMISQNIKGKIYDDESVVRGASIVNRTQNSATYSDDAGNFKLNAAINDSIVIRSSFHLEQRMVIKAHHLEAVFIIELKKVVNTLDEVFLTKEPDVQPFDVVESKSTLENQILEDIKRNPHLYGKAPSGNFDVIAVAKLIGKLFKSKKPTQEIQTTATYAQLEHLFKTDSYFNAAFLQKELHISPDYHYLFIEYCEAYAIDSKLLLVENRFMLLDTLLKCSADFMQIVDSNKKE